MRTLCRARSSRALTGCLAALAAATALVITPGSAAGSTKIDLDADSTEPFTFALLGDLPYGAEDTAAFPDFIDTVNSADDVELVVHVGDIKSGGTSCDDGALTSLRDDFMLFEDPVVYTPGDNEWTDCHRTSNGSFVPTERLDMIRALFFPQKNRTFGDPYIKVDSQAQRQPQEHKTYVENVMFEAHGVQFATIHVVGSNNNLNPWSQLPDGDQPLVRLDEFSERQAAALEWLLTTFEAAADNDTSGVFIAIHGNPLEAEPDSGFAGFVAMLEQLAADYAKPVMLAHGDFHFLIIDQPLPGAPNVTRVQTYGAEIENWLAITIDADTPEVFSIDSRTHPDS